MGAGSFSLSSFRPLQLVSLAGLIVAVISTILPWVKVSAFGSTTANAWSSNLYKDLQFAKWAGNVSFPLDAIIILVIALVGLYFVVAPMLGKSAPQMPFIGVAVIFGGLEIVVGVLNYLHIHDQIKGVDGVSVGFGLYVLIVGGALTIIGAFLDQQQQTKM
jgi:hypothetical protein